MAQAYRISNPNAVHFITCTITDWIDLFTRPVFADIVIDSLQYCRSNKGLHIHAWVLMTNHLHLIVSSDKIPLNDILRDFKKFTAKNLYKEILNAKYIESRRDWILRAFQARGMGNPDNSTFQVWQPGFHPVELKNSDMAEQRLNYLHDNPVRAGIVRQTWDYRYSSAIDYMTEKPGLLPIVFL